MDASRNVHSVPPPQTQTRDELVARLLAAGLRLAMDQVRPRTAEFGVCCLECQAFVRQDRRDIEHHVPGCRVAEILRLSERLTALPVGELQSDPQFTDERSHAEASRSVAGASEGTPAPDIFAVVDDVMAKYGIPPALEGFGEPWTVDDEGDVIDASGNVVVDEWGCTIVEPDDAACMRRIAACVNVCEGLATDALERIAITRVKDGPPAAEAPARAAISAATLKATLQHAEREREVFAKYLAAQDALIARARAALERAGEL